MPWVVQNKYFCYVGEVPNRTWNFPETEGYTILKYVSRIEYATRFETFDEAKLEAEKYGEGYEPIEVSA